MQAEYIYEKLTDDIPIANLITFQEWVTLKQYGNITKGFNEFAKEELDGIAVFYDKDMVFLDYLERREVEEITPAFVLLPRFFWEKHRDTIPAEFIPGMRIDDRIQILNHRSSEYWVTLQNRALADIDLLKCKATPREEQLPALEFFQNEMQNKHSIRGILQATPGYGKTASSIMLAASFRAKTLIIVPNEVLQDQWIDAIIDFTDLTLDNIGVIQGSDISKIESDIFALEHMDTKVIYIVKIQSLYSQIKRNNISELQKLYSGVDLVVFDEVHGTGGATNYSKTSSLFMTPNIMGLTATPYRTKINEYMLTVSIGEVAYKADHNNLTPDIEIHNVFVPFTENDSKRVRQVQGDYNMQLGIFGACMKNKNTYFEYLSDVVAWNHSQGHNIVVLFPTIALMENLLRNIETRHPDLFEKTLLLKGKTKVDAMEMVKEERKILMQEYKEYKEYKDQQVKNKEIKRKDYQVIIRDQRAEIDKKILYLKEHALDLYKQNVNHSEIIISNYNLLSAGFDKSQLSNIIFGGAPRIGKISVIQSIGRITRIHEGKLKPLAQYFIPSPFFEINKSTGIILNRNIKIQYEEAIFKYKGFQND